MSGSNDASFLVLGDSSWTSIVTQFEITRDMRLNTIYDFINDAERFTCDGSRCTLYLNTGRDVIDYFVIDADYVGRMFSVCITTVYVLQTYGCE